MAGGAGVALAFQPRDGGFVSKKYIISDLHLGHKNILKFAGTLRGGSTSEEHDEWIIEQINSTVTKHDLLYICGDVAFDDESLRKVGQIRGQKFLVRGNHDIGTINKYTQYFANIYGITSYKGTFWLTHAPIHPQELRGRYNIHGHTHQHSILKENGELDSRYINASVEMTYGIPQSLDDLLEKHKDEVYQNRKLIKEENEKNKLR